MKLKTINSSRFLIESDRPSWGRKEYVSYSKIKKGKRIKTDPVILYLGTWNRILKSNVKRTYWCAIELNQLDSEQIAALRHALPDILKQPTVYKRYWEGKRHVPDIFTQYYRTYRIENIGSRVKGKLYSIAVKDVDREKAALKASEKGFDYDSLSDSEKSEWIGGAVRERGREEEEQQIKAALERRKDGTETSPEFQQQPEISPVEPPEEEKEPPPESPSSFY